MARQSLHDHRKFHRLCRLLGECEPHALGHLEYLWKAGYASADPFVGDSRDVEAAAKWDGPPGVFTESALVAGFLDKTDNGFAIHDLFDHAPQYVLSRAKKAGRCTPCTGEEAPLYNDARARAQISKQVSKQVSKSATASKQAASGKTAVAAATNPDDEIPTLRRALEAAGLAPAFAQKAVESSDAALIREVLAYHAARRTTLRNPSGALRSMLANPDDWGFQRIEGGWRRPTIEKTAATKEEVEQRRAVGAEARRKRDAEESAERRKSEEIARLNPPSPEILKALKAAAGKDVQ